MHDTIGGHCRWQDHPRPYMRLWKQEGWTPLDQWHSHSIYSAVVPYRSDLTDLLYVWETRKQRRSDSWRSTVENLRHRWPCAPQLRLGRNLAISQSDTLRWWECSHPLHGWTPSSRRSHHFDACRPGTGELDDAARYIKERRPVLDIPGLMKDRSLRHWLYEMHANLQLGNPFPQPVGYIATNRSKVHLELAQQGVTLCAHKQSGGKASRLVNPFSCTTEQEALGWSKEFCSLCLARAPASWQPRWSGTDGC